MVMESESFWITIVKKFGTTAIFKCHVVQRTADIDSLGIVRIPLPSTSRIGAALVWALSTNAQVARAARKNEIIFMIS